MFLYLHEIKLHVIYLYSLSNSMFKVEEEAEGSADHLVQVHVENAC